MKTTKLLETCHSVCLSKPKRVEDFRCPFCLYQTENKNNLIDHIISHRGRLDGPENAFSVPIHLCSDSPCSAFPLALEEHAPGAARPITLACGLLCSFTNSSSENPHMHLMKREAIQPYRCRLCYFDCTQLRDLEAHLTDKHQVRICSRSFLSSSK